MSEEMRIQSRKKLKSVRRFIGSRMLESLQTMPQATAVFDLETDALFKLKDELKAKEPAVTVTSLFVKLMAGVLQAYPILNSAVVGEELIVYDSCNVGVGVGLENGIMTVVVREAQDKDIFTIARELREKTELVKQGQLPLDEMKGSTFTISSIGVQGLRYSSVVLNPPESAMLGIGVTQRILAVQPDDSTAIRRVTSFSFTHNHTVLDGYHVGEGVRLLRERLADPAAHMGL